MAFRIAHVNIRSLLSSHDDIAELLNAHNFDLLALSETWLEPNYPDKFISVDEYYIERKHRKKRGDGVACYIRNSLKSKLISVEFVNTMHTEQLWICIKSGTRSVAVGTVYRPPNSPIASLTEL